MNTIFILKAFMLSLSFILLVNFLSYSQSLTEQRKAIAKTYANKHFHKHPANNLRIDTLNDIEQSITNVLFGGCVNISNLTYTGPHLSIGYFVDTSATLGIDSGLVMTTGSVTGIEDSASYWASTDNGMPGDSLLGTLISGYFTYDASIIEFDFIPLADTIIGCQYVFGSEEYPEWVGSDYNDVFGFFISGPGISGIQNLALIPGTNIPVAINNVNAGSYSQYYTDNTNGADWCYDGYTSPFTISCPVIPNSLYHFKIAIADAGDHIYDSGVFLKGGSFLGNSPLAIAKFAHTIDIATNTVTFINQSENSNKYSWDFGDGATSSARNPVHVYQAPGIYNARLIACNFCHSDTTYQQVNFFTFAIPNNQNNKPFLTVSTVDNGIFNLSLSFEKPQDFTMQVFNNNGQLVINDKTYHTETYQGSIDLRKFADGLYYLNIVYGNEKISYKLVK